MRVFLDANILFSAAKSDGAVRHLLRLLLDRGHECWADAYVVSEARRNLVAKGPEALQVLDALLAHLRVAPAQAAVEAQAETAWLPEKDRPVLSAAIRLGCDALVTGDRTHFGSGYGRAFGGVKIHSPRSLAESLLA
jgi:predicted nucleic acid-binding protein